MLKTITLLVAAVLALSSCAEGMVGSAINKEDAAWRVVQAREQKECAQFRGEGKRRLALKAYQCKATIVREEVLPNAAYPDIVLAALQDLGKISKRYYDGRITREQANFEINQVMMNHQQQEITRYKEAYQQAQMRDQQQQQNFRQGLALGVMATNPHSSYSSPSLTTTDCRQTGNGVTCNTFGNSVQQPSNSFSTTDCRRIGSGITCNTLGN